MTGKREIRTIVLLLAVTLYSMVQAVAGDDPLAVNNVVIVLDGSGSMLKKMSGTNVVKMDAAKKALKEVLAHVPEDTQIGLLVFASGVKEPWQYPLGPRDDRKLVQVIDRIKPGGRTPLGAFIQLGYKALQQQRKAQLGYGTYRLLVVTDGEATDPKVMNQSVPLALANGMRLDVIGVDMGKKHALAQSSHSYRRADDPASLSKAVADVFAEINDSSDVGATDDAFAEIASIPEGTARQMITALTKPVTKTGATPSSSAQSPSAPVNKPLAPTAPPAPVATQDDGGFASYGTILFFVFAFMVILGKLFGRKR